MGSYFVPWDKKRWGKAGLAFVYKNVSEAQLSHPFNMDVKNCFCNVPYATSVDPNDSTKVWARCGAEVNYKEGKLGCNMMAPKKNVPALWEALMKMSRFKEYTLTEHPLDFAMEWPKCEHMLYMALKKCESDGLNYNKPFFSCDAKKPNKQCKRFYINESFDYGFTGTRQNDREWLEKYGELEIRELFQRVREKKQKKQQRSKEVSREEETVEEEEEEEAVPVKKKKVKSIKIKKPKPLMDWDQPSQMIVDSDEDN